MVQSTAIAGSSLKGGASRRAAVKAAGATPAKGRTKTRKTAGVIIKSAKSRAVPKRTSEILRELLKNKDRSFTVQKISEELGTSSFGVSLLAFSIPEVVPIPVPGMSAVVALPTGVISAQMAMGNKEIRLPKWLLKRRVPRKALAAAIHAILPVLERMERATKPRGRWVTNPLVKRLLGAFIFLLALFIALPVPGTNMPPAIAIFVTSLGMIEQDGWMIALGILIGLASMIFIAGVTFGTFALFNQFFGAGA
jgi:hypothetical protein